MTAIRDVTANRQIVIDRAVNAGAFAPAARYVEMLWLDTVSWPVALLAAFGALGMLAVAPSRAIFLLAFPVPFLVFIANTAPASRYLNPVVPFMTLFAAWALARIMSRIAAHRPALFWVVVAVAACRGFWPASRQIGSSGGTIPERWRSVSSKPTSRPVRRSSRNPTLLF